MTRRDKFATLVDQLSNFKRRELWEIFNEMEKELEGRKMTAVPRIDWNFKHLPSNRDEMQPLGTHEFDGQELLVAVNHTQKSIIFIWGDNYGKLVSGGE